MIRPDFSKFTTLSATKNGGDSEIVWREFLITAQTFINHCSYKVKEEELSEITKSLQNWTTKRLFTEYNEKDASGNWVPYTVQKGEIYIADLGLNQELAYCHPVLILDIIEDRVFVVPATTSPQKINDAFHPATNPGGLKRYRRVYRSDGFGVDSALMLQEARIISKGRLIDRKGLLNEDISSSNSIFQEVSETCFSLMFNELYIEKKSLIQEIANLNQKISELESAEQKTMS